MSPGPRSTRPMTRSRIGAKLLRFADRSSDLRKLTKLGDKLMDLRAWGVPGSDLRAWGVIWERKLRGPRSTRPLTRSRIGAKLHRLADKSSDWRKLTELGNKLMDLRAWGVPGSDLRTC